MEPATLERHLPDLTSMEPTIFGETPVPKSIFTAAYSRLWKTGLTKHRRFVELSTQFAIVEQPLSQTKSS